MLGGSSAYLQAKPLLKAVDMKLTLASSLILRASKHKYCLTLINGNYFQHLFVLTKKKILLEIVLTIFVSISAYLSSCYHIPWWRVWSHLLHILQVLSSLKDASSTDLICPGHSVSLHWISAPNKLFQSSWEDLMIFCLLTSFS